MKSFLERPTYFGLSRRRLQTLYLAAAAGLAALVPLLLFAGFWVRSEFSKSQKDVDLLLGTRAGALSESVDGTIQQQFATLKALSALPSLDDGDLGPFGEAARRLTGVMPNWVALSLIQPATGQVLLATRPERPERPDPRLLAEAAAGGKPLVATRPAAGEEPAAALLYVPVIRNGAVIGVLLMTFDLADIRDTVAAAVRDGPLMTIVADVDDRILARAPAADLGPELSPKARAAIAGRRSGVYQSTAPDGEPITVAFSRSPVTGWVAITSIAQSRSDSLTSRSVLIPTAAGVLSLLIAGILAVFIIHTVMERRVSEERLAASRALGDLDARLLATSQESLNEQRKAASEREVLMREIYHRVKNNLQIVQSLLRLGSRDLRPDQREPFESAVRRIGAMSRVHTLLYNSPDLASIDFKDYLEELLKELSDGFAGEKRGIDHVLEADAMRMSLDTAVPLAFIAVEILTNSYKHAFPQGRSGRITVEVDRDDGEARLLIRDDGIGMAENAASKRRLGLTIVRKLVQQIGGKFEEPRPGDSVFVIRFPLDPAAPMAQPGLPVPAHA